MYYSYKVYGICIHSNIRLPELSPSNDIADLTIQIDREGDKVKHICQQPSVISGRLEGVGTFYIQQGKTVVIDPHTHDMDMLRPAILGGILAAALRQRGMLVLHASCVNIENQAIAFMGDSGWGKSTLAAAFHHQGNSILTDDVMAIQFDELMPFVVPGFPQIKLWPDAADAFGHKPGQLPSLYSNAPKLSYCFDQGFQQEPLPLTRLYVLRKGAQDGPLCEIKPLTHQSAFLELVKHTREMIGMSSADIREAHFHQCTALLQSVKVSYLIRRPQLNNLADVVEHIKHHVLAQPEAIAP